MKKKEADRSRTMERRQFLGVSAAAGASTALSGCAIGGATTEGAEPVRMPGAGQTMCDLHWENITWAMTSKRLNTLWTLLWPRVAARVWKKDTFWPEEASVASPFDIRNWLATQITWFLVNGRGSDTFRKAIEDLQSHLFSRACPPIWLLGAGGYDFYVTERGLYLWAPPSPEKPIRRQLMAMYEYRRTGRPPIAIGSVRVTAGVLPEAPTGPGQIETMTPEVFTELGMSQQDGFRVCGVVAGWSLNIDLAARRVLDARQAWSTSEGVWNGA